VWPLCESRLSGTEYIGYDGGGLATYNQSASINSVGTLNIGYGASGIFGTGGVRFQAAGDPDIVVKQLTAIP